MNTSTTILSYILAVGFGFLLGWGILFYIGKKKAYVGTMRVIRAEDKLLYSLEMHEDPSVLEFQREVIFRVDTSGESS